MFSMSAEVQCRCVRHKMHSTLMAPETSGIPFCFYLTQFPFSSNREKQQKAFRKYNVTQSASHSELRLNMSNMVDSKQLSLSTEWLN